MNKIKFVVFDLYGTLIYLPNKFRAYAKMLRALESKSKFFPGDKTSLLMARDYADLSEMKEMIFPDADIDISRFKNEVDREIESVEVYPEAIEVLEKLKAHGYEIGVISNLATPYKKPYYALGINKFCSCGIFSCEVGYKKPQPEIYRLIQERFALKGKEILMVGDSYKNDYAVPIFLGWNALFLDRSGTEGVESSLRDLSGLFAYL